METIELILPLILSQRMVEVEVVDTQQVLVGTEVQVDEREVYKQQQGEQRHKQIAEDEHDMEMTVELTLHLLMVQVEDEREQREQPEQLEPQIQDEQDEQVWISRQYSELVFEILDYSPEVEVDQDMEDDEQAEVEVELIELNAPIIQQQTVELTELVEVEVEVEEQATLELNGLVREETEQSSLHTRPTDPMELILRRHEEQRQHSDYILYTHSQRTVLGLWFHILHQHTMQYHLAL